LIFCHNSLIIIPVVDGKERPPNKTDSSGGNTMTAFKNNSEMMLAIEGARGPPGSQKRNLFQDYFNCHYSSNKVRSKMSQPKTIKAGFKAPPLDALSGRGPPITKKRDSFLIGICRRPPLYPIIYT
jgi:hypothetical protein